MTKIKKQIAACQAAIKKQTDKIEVLQAKCPHTKYVKGLTIIACIQECWICDECGEAKPLQYDWFSDDPND